MKKTIEKIAKEILRINTLRTRNSDALDFHDVGVASLRAALEAAYRAGRRHGVSNSAFARKTDEEREVR